MKVTPINLTRMTNEVHVQFHECVITVIDRITPEELGIASLYGQYRSAFSNETDALLIIRKSELTARIAEQDRVRDSIFRGFADTVKGSRNHFDIEVREAANRLWSLFLHYGNVARKTFDAQSAAINDMMREFQQTEMAQAIEFLNVGDWRDRLDEENQKFHQLMMDRYTEAAGKTTFRMKTARVETDRLYRAIIAHANNVMLIDLNTAPMNELVNELNAIVRRFKNILAQQLGRRS